jgi:NAD(P)-dependent dehydrogenase (short-subunit alcohol dehydrogenase family)/acyl dehydratase
LARPEARVFRSDQIEAGQRTVFERKILREDVEAFANLLGDHNPLHTDESYAALTNYGMCIVHGAFQVGLASTMAGMYLPGRNVVIGSMRSRFPSPLYVPAEVLVQGEITSWLPRAGSGTLRVRVVDTSQAVLTAEIHVGFGLHDNTQRSSLENVPPAPQESGLPVVLLTGAGSSVGLQLLQHLSASYQVLAMVRSRPMASRASSGDNIELVECDLLSEDWESAVDAALAGRAAYGIVHAAWPGAPKGGLLGIDYETVSRHVEFGTLTTIRLARWLVQHARGSGRMVVIGTTAATIKPASYLGAYALGKASMEQTVRLLAPELAGKGITINAVLPSFMPMGMNRAKTRQAVLAETAKVPLGRLCSPEDIAGSVEYLLSANASFVVGQILPLTGGQL